MFTSTTAGLQSSSSRSSTMMPPESPSKAAGQFHSRYYTTASKRASSLGSQGGGGGGGPSTPLSLGEAVCGDEYGGLMGGGGGVGGESAFRHNRSSSSSSKPLFPNTAAMNFSSSSNGGHPFNHMYNSNTSGSTNTHNYYYDNSSSGKQQQQQDDELLGQQQPGDFAAKEGLTGPRLWSDYHHIEKIGEGNFGVVFKATHDLDGQIYAIKKTSKPIVSDADLQHRLQEVYALAQLTSGATINTSCSGGAIQNHHRHRNDDIPDDDDANASSSTVGSRYILRYFDSWVEEMEGGVGGGAPSASDFGEPLRGMGGRSGGGGDSDDGHIDHPSSDGCAICIRMEFVNGGNLDKRAYTVRDPLREVCVGVLSQPLQRLVSNSSFDIASASSSTTASGLGEKRSTRSRSHDFGDEERSKFRRPEGGGKDSGGPPSSSPGGTAGSYASIIDSNITPPNNPVPRRSTNRSRSPSVKDEDDNSSTTTTTTSNVRHLSAALPLPPSCTPPQRPIPPSSHVSPSSMHTTAANTLGDKTLPFLRLLPERILELIFHMATALHQIHQRFGIVHLDVKPDNIFCSIHDNEDPNDNKEATTPPTTHHHHHHEAEKDDEASSKLPPPILRQLSSSFSSSVARHRSRQAVVFKLGDFGLARPINSVSATGETFRGVNDDEGDRRYLCPYLLSGEQPLMLESADIFSLGRSVLDLIVPSVATTTVAVSSEEVSGGGGGGGMDKRFRSLVDIPLPPTSNAGHHQFGEDNEVENDEHSHRLVQQEKLLLEVLQGQCQPRTPADVSSSGCPLVAPDVVSLVSSSTPLLRPSSPISPLLSDTFPSTADVPNGVRVWAFPSTGSSIEVGDDGASSSSSPLTPLPSQSLLEKEREDVLAPLAALISSMVHPDPYQRPSTLYIMTTAFKILRAALGGGVNSSPSSTTQQQGGGGGGEGDDMQVLSDIQTRIEDKAVAAADLEDEIQRMMAALGEYNESSGGGGGDEVNLSVPNTDSSVDHFHPSPTM